MKYKNALIRSAVIVSILILSVCIGLLYQYIWDKIDHSRYPMPDTYSQYVTEYSGEYGVPEYMIYSVIKTESGFDSSAVSPKGAVGLMQIMPDTFTWLMTLTGEAHDTGMLYDPETNIKYGTYFLSYLYVKYGKWDTALAAYNAGSHNVDDWLADPALNDGDGKLLSIPYEETATYVKRVNSAVDIYRRLYFDGQ